MAKPNENQLALLDYLSTQIEYWKRTNDINSPTHQGDMEEEMWKIDDFGILDDEQRKEFLDSLNNLFKVVRKV